MPGVPMKFRGQLVEGGFLFPPHESWGLNSGLHTFLLHTGSLQLLFQIILCPFLVSFDVCVWGWVGGMLTTILCFESLLIYPLLFVKLVGRS